MHGSLLRERKKVMQLLTLDREEVINTVLLGQNLPLCYRTRNCSHAVVRFLRPRTAVTFPSQGVSAPPSFSFSASCLSQSPCRAVTFRHEHSKQGIASRLTDKGIVLPSIKYGRGRGRKSAGPSTTVLPARQSYLCRANEEHQFQLHMCTV